MYCDRLNPFWIRYNIEDESDALARGDEDNMTNTIRQFKVGGKP